MMRGGGFAGMRAELDHGKLDVCRAALDFAAWACTVCRTLLANRRACTGTGTRKTRANQRVQATRNSSRLPLVGPCAALHDPAGGRIAVYHGGEDTVTAHAFCRVRGILVWLEKHGGTA